MGIFFDFSPLDPVLDPYGEFPDPGSALQQREPDADLDVDGLVLLLLYVVRLALYDGGNPVLVPLLVRESQPLLQPATHAPDSVPLHTTSIY